MEASPQTPSSLPDGITSFLDTDLYKLTMQNAILQFFPNTVVEYTFTNRTPQMRLSRPAFNWFQSQVAKLANIRLRREEREFLEKDCPFLTPEYLDWLGRLCLKPDEQVEIRFEPDTTAVGDHGEQFGNLSLQIRGRWVETVLYEIPLLALTSEAYFKFVDTDWSHDGQEEAAYQKGQTLFEAGCMVSEFGSRRRRDWHTQDLVVHGLKRASDDVNKGQAGTSTTVGKLTGTSNVFFAMRHGLAPVGTVAHEWYMGLASIHDDYQRANELGLKYWVDCFGEGVLGIALTDTFGTPAFFSAFQQKSPASEKTYAQIFQGVRQDSGDPKTYVKMASEFYESQKLSGKTIVFSDSLNVEKCVEYKAEAERHGFRASFGVGTFFTNDFVVKSAPSQKSKPLNIVIKLSQADGRPSVKISDNAGKNTGDQSTVDRVKKELGYSERGWEGGDESKRW